MAWKGTSSGNYGAEYQRLRKLVLAGAAGKTCGLCGRTMNPPAERLSVDHIVPLAVGGGHDRSNLRPVHYACNIKAGSRLGGRRGRKTTRKTTRKWVSRW